MCVCVCCCFLCGGCRWADAYLIFTNSFCSQFLLFCYLHFAHPRHPIDMGESKLFFFLRFKCTFSLSLSLSHMSSAQCSGPYALSARNTQNKIYIPIPEQWFVRRVCALMVLYVNAQAKMMTKRPHIHQQLTMYKLFFVVVVVSYSHPCDCVFVHLFVSKNSNPFGTMHTTYTRAQYHILENNPWTTDKQTNNNNDDDYDESKKKKQKNRKIHVHDSKQCTL